MLHHNQAAAVVAHERAHMVGVAEKEIRKLRKPWWLWIAAASCIGALAVGAYAMFVRPPSARVVINLPVELGDASLSYFLDGNPIESQALAQPIDLPLGRHELAVNRGSMVLRRFEFNVARSSEPIQLTELLPPLSDDPDRTAAELVQMLGGSVSIAPNAMTFLGPKERLPDGPCKPVSVKLGAKDLSAIHAEVLGRSKSIRGIAFGSVPTDCWRHFAALPNLQRLSVAKRNLSEADIEQIGKLVTLLSLAIAGPNVNDKTLTHLKGLTKLEILDLSGSAVTDAGLSNLPGIRLSELHLSGTPITNNCTTALENLKTLRRLDVADTKIDNDGVADLVDRLPECWVSPPVVVDAGVARQIAALEAQFARNPNTYDFVLHNSLRHNYQDAKSFRKLFYHCNIILRNQVMEEYTLGCIGGDKKEGDVNRLLEWARRFPEYRFVVAAARIRAAEMVADQSQARQLLQQVIKLPGSDLDAYRDEARKRLAALP